MRTSPWLNVTTGSLCVLALCLVEANAFNRPRDLGAPAPQRAAEAARFAEGSRVPVRLGDFVSSETAHGGDAWRAITLSDLVALDGSLVPSGSAVSGIVSDVRAVRGTQATIGLRMVSIAVDGRMVPIQAWANAGQLARASIVSTSKVHRHPRASRSGVHRTVESGRRGVSSDQPLVLPEGATLTFRVE